MRRLRRENVWLDGGGLREVDGRVINVAAAETETQEDVGYSARAGGNGQALIRRQRRSKQIQVQFGIRELYDLAERTRVVDAVNAWARDGMLQISSRPDQMAQVVVTKYASAMDVRGYTDTYSLTFEAAGVPYWQDIRAARLELSGTSGTGEIVVNGNTPTVLEVVVTPSAALNSLRITVTGADGNVREFEFADLAVAADTDVVITHDARGILRMTAGSAGLIGKRTAESDDELAVSPGVATVAFAADASCEAVFTARGWYR